MKEESNAKSKQEDNPSRLIMNDERWTTNYTSFSFVRSPMHNPGKKSRIVNEEHRWINVGAGGEDKAIKNQAYNIQSL